MTTQPLRRCRVLVVDDHPLMRRALCAMIADEPDFEVAGEAGHGAEAVARARALQPDLVVLDLLMPVLDGVEATAALCAERPETRVLVLTSAAEPERVAAALRAGALGYALKNTEPEELLRALREVAAGREYLAAGLGRQLAAQTLPAGAALTARELEVLRLLGEGVSNRVIAQQLSISEATARAHVYHILNKLGLDNRSQAALYYAAHHGQPPRSA